jgi:hypothetical protein
MSTKTIRVKAKVHFIQPFDHEITVSANTTEDEIANIIMDMAYNEVVYNGLDLHRALQDVKNIEVVK